MNPGYQSPPTGSPSPVVLASPVSNVSKAGFLTLPVGRLFHTLSDLYNSGLFLPVNVHFPFLNFNPLLLLILFP